MEKEDQKVTIIVNKRSHHIQGHSITAEELQSLAAAPADYEVWQIIKSPDPEGQLPKDDVRVTGSITVKSGDRFRVVPSGTFGGTIPEEIARQVKALQVDGRAISVSRGADSHYHITDSDRRLPPGYNKPAATILVRLPASYPNGNPDMFWADHDLRLASGGMPQNCSVEQIEGRPWLRFSWHPRKWNPGADDLGTYLEFVELRLIQVK